MVRHMFTLTWHFRLVKTFFFFVQLATQTWCASIKFPRRMQDMSRDSGGDNMAGTSQLWEPPHGQTSSSTQPPTVPPPPSDKVKRNLIVSQGGWKKTKTHQQCTYISKRQAVIFVLPDALVLTSPLCFSTEVCLPGLFLLLRLELLLRPRGVMGEVTADIWRGLSEPVREFTIETQRMNAKSNLIVICDVLHAKVNQ